LEQVKLQTGSGVRLVFAVHAYRAGRLLLGPDGPSHVPYIIILGGTDVNEYQEDPVKAAVMALAVNGARKVVAFTVTMAELALRHWSTLTPEKVVTITQAVVTIPSTEYSLRRKFGLGGQIRSSPPFSSPGECVRPTPSLVSLRNEQDFAPSVWNQGGEGSSVLAGRLCGVEENGDQNPALCRRPRARSHTYGRVLGENIRYRGSMVPGGA